MSQSTYLAFSQPMYRRSAPTPLLLVACVGLAAATLFSARSYGETIEQFFDRQQAVGYAAAKATGNSSLMVQMDPGRFYRDQGLVLDDESQARLAAETFFMINDLRRELREAHKQQLKSYTVDDAMKQFTSSHFVSLGAAKKSECPSNPSIKLDLSEDFFVAVRKHKNTRGDITRFYTLVTDKYFAADTPAEKNHWFFYAVKVSGMAKQLKQLLDSGEHATFITTLKSLYRLAETPDLDDYFPANEASALESKLNAKNPADKPS